MLFEAITFASIYLVKALIEKKVSENAATASLEAVKEEEMPKIERQQAITPELDSCRTERRNEIFLQIYSILVNPEKSKFEQLTSAFKQLVRIYSILGEQSSHLITEYVMEDFNSYVSSMKNAGTVVERMESLQPLLEHSLRTSNSITVVGCYLLDIGKDTKCAQTVWQDIYGCFDVILHDKYSNTQYNVQTEDIKNYYCLLGKAGDVYRDMVKVLRDYELFDAYSRLSHELLYEIAEHILKTTQFYFCKGLTTDRLAKDITDSIIHFIHNDVGIDREVAWKYADNPDKLVEKLIERYLLNRDIESYYYFLKMACKVLNALKYKEVKEDERIRIAKEKLGKIDLPILGNYTKEEILNDIEQAFKHKNAELSKKEVKI